MLGIGRQDAGAGLRRTLHEEIAGADQAFLVGKRYRRTAIDGGKRRLQAGRTADGCHHPVGGTRGRLDDRAFTGAAFGTRTGKCGLQFAKTGGIGDRRKARAELFCQFCKSVDVGVRGQRLDLVAVAGAAQQIHRAVADRAGGAQHRDGAHGCDRGLVVTQWNCAHRFTKP